MPCIAAIKATRAELRQIALSPAEIWNKVRWWTPATIEDALMTLVGSKECVAEVISPGVVGYRRSPEPPPIQIAAYRKRGYKR